MSENLFLGDATYPHTPSLIERLRGSFTMSSYGSISNMAKELLILTDEAADRIEQLELAVRHRDAVINEIETIAAYKSVIDYVDAAIQEGK